MTEAIETTADETEPTLEEFVAEIEAESDSEAETEGTPAEQPPEAEAEPEQTFEVNGEQVPISELIGGFMKGADYTQKTQELAMKREEAEMMKAAVDRFYESPAVPEWQPPMPGAAPSGEPASPPEFATDFERKLYEQNQKTQQAVSALQTENKQRKQRDMLQATDNTLFGYKDAHPELTEAEVVQISQAVRQGVRDGDLSYTQKSFERVRVELFPQSIDDVKKQAVEDYRAEQKANKAKSEAAALEPGSTPAMSKAPPDIRNMTEEQVDALLLREFKDMG